MSELVIETQALTKRYGQMTAVDGLDLGVHQGEVYGLLGPNGAGKTTTILMLLGLTEPTAGRVRVLGLDPARQPLSVKAKVGYLPERVGFYDELTARENLTYIAKLNGIPREEARRRIDEGFARMGLSEVADRRVATFSRGMRQRLGVADVLLKQPKLIILDEPTQGLDPEGAREFLHIIRSLKSEGITILLSSHLLHQVQAVCDRVGLFHRGRMVLEGTVDELARRALGSSYRIRVQADGAQPVLTEALQRVPGVVNVTPEGSNRYVVEATGDLRAEAAQAVVAAGGRLLALDVEAPSLEDIYTRTLEEVEHGPTA
ncbi:MAG: ABC transporter ATP-binding protein [Anaerolineae bacterium]|nr:ABC transporter ATP-binding protein [Anaerolineae bacterium]